MYRRFAFTLVELLVVVTIIVVLLAMLMPAMSKAIYQATIAVCRTNLKTVGTGAITYAHDNRRSYPYRKTIKDYYGVEVDPIKLTVANANDSSRQPIDDRPTLKTHIPLKALVCPMNNPQDLEISGPDTYVYTSYPLWFGWQYTTGRSGTAAGNLQQGMDRLGDSMEFTDGGDTEFFNVLAGDSLHIDNVNMYGFASHPNKYPSTWIQDNVQDRPTSWAGNEKTTHSWFVGGLNTRVDSNYVMDDASVHRYNDVKLTYRDAEGLQAVWLFSNAQEPNRHLYIPAR